MKTTIIQLETHDDYVTVRDRLAFAKSERVVLIWPEEGILTRLLDLVLLQRAARQEGQLLGLVTRNPEVTKNAEELGIPVFRNQKRALRGTWRRKPQKMRLMRPRRNFLPPAVELRKIQPSRGYPIIHWFPRLIIFSLAILSIFSLIFVLIPAATIYLPLETSTQEMPVSIWLSPDLTASTLAGGVPVRVDNVIIEKEGEIASTGWISKPDKPALGEIAATNLTEESYVIPKGMVVLTSGSEPVRFLTTQSVTLAAGVGQTIIVKIQAEQAGMVGNVPADYIRAVEGLAGLNISVNNPTATSGGSNKTVRAPAEADVEKLQQQLKNEMFDQAEEILRGYNIEGAYVIPQTVRISQVIEEERVPEVGQSGDTLRLHLKAEFEGWVVMAEDLLSVARNILDANLPANMIGVEQSGSWQMGDTFTVEENGLRGNMVMKRRMIPVIDIKELTKMVMGKKVKSIKEMLLEQYSLVGEPIILTNPGWWPWMPVIDSQIKVEFR